MGFQKKWTPAEAERRELVRELGCVCCERATALGFTATGMAVQVHHAKDGGFVRGNAFTWPACAWHHMGDCKPGKTTSAMTRDHGPSLAKGTRPFVAVYGTDDDMIAIVRDRLGEPA